MASHRYLPGHLHAHRADLAGNIAIDCTLLNCILYSHGLVLFLYMMSYDVSTLPFSYALRI